MNRTTMALDDEVIRGLKRRAAAGGTSMARVANDLLRRALKEQPGGPRERKPAPWPTHDSGAPRVDINDRDALFDAMDREP
jgi:plasmid stability protein